MDARTRDGDANPAPALLRSVIRDDWRDDAGLREPPGPMEWLVVESPVTDGERRRARGQPSRAFADNGRNPR